MKYILYIFIFITLGFLLGCNEEPEPIEIKPIIQYTDAEVRKVSKKIDDIFSRANERHGFNGSILVAKKGQVLINKEYGYTNFRKKTLIDSASSFQLASVSKQFTAAAILILYEQEKLDLNNPITQYFPDFPYPEITIKQCLSHTSAHTRQLSVTISY